MTTPQILLPTALAMEQFAKLSCRINEPISIKILRHPDGRLWVHSADDVNQHILEDEGLYQAISFLLMHA